jgi:hypothetical protein
MSAAKPWITGLAGLRGIAQQSRDHAGLCRPEGHGPMEWRSCRPEGMAWQYGDCACVDSQLAGLGGVAWQSRDRSGLCRPEGPGPAELR